MKLCLIALTALICLATAETSGRDKRFLVDTLKSLENTVKGIIKGGEHDLKDIAEKVGLFTSDTYKTTYEKAQEEFENIKAVAGKIPFSRCVKTLIPLLSAGVTVAICTGVCENSADAIFGASYAVVADAACPTVCTAALAQIADYAQKHSG